MNKSKRKQRVYVVMDFRSNRILGVYGNQAAAHWHEHHALVDMGGDTSMVTTLEFPVRDNREMEWYLNSSLYDRN